MKKIISLLLAMIMVFSLATVAFAVVDPEVEPSTPNAPKLPADFRSEEVEASITIEKLYEVTGALQTDGVTEKTDLFPVETLTFKSVPATTNPDQTNLILDTLTVVGNANQELDITLPVYSKVGVYEYTISENAEAIEDKQAVDYSEAEIKVTVLVTYNYDDEKLDTKVVLSTPVADKDEDSDDLLPDANKDGKVDTFINKYDVGHLSVTKTVSGNLASTSQYFDFTVEFTSDLPVASNIDIAGGSDASCTGDVVIEIGDWEESDDGYTYTHEFKLKADETLNFFNIPAGVAYTVLESDAHNAEDANGTDSTKGYTTTGEVKAEDNASITVDELAEVTINNDKDTDVNTGISLDSAPYFVILAVAMFGMVALVSKKRYEV